MGKSRCDLYRSREQVVSYPPPAVQTQGHTDDLDCMVFVSIPPLATGEPVTGPEGEGQAGKGAKLQGGRRVVVCGKE